MTVGWSDHLSNLLHLLMPSSMDFTTTWLIADQFSSWLVLLLVLLLMLDDLVAGHGHSLPTGGLLSSHGQLLIS
jgi:hypothetical protein